MKDLPDIENLCTHKLTVAMNTCMRSRQLKHPSRGNDDFTGPILSQ